MLRNASVFELAVALVGIGLAANAAFAVVAWLYLLVAVGGPIQVLAIGVVFAIVGTLIVVGILRAYDQ